MNSSIFSNYVLTGLKNILFLSYAARIFRVTSREGDGDKRHRKQEKKPQGARIHPGSDAWVPRASLGFQLRGTSPWKAQEEADPKAAGEITETKTLTQKQTSRAYSKTTNALLVLGAWLVATTKPSPDSPDMRSCVGDKVLIRMFYCFFLLL